MNNFIIANTVNFVNAPFQEVESFPNARKWRDKKLQSKAVAKRLEEIELYERATRMRDCAEMVSLSYCPHCNTTQLNRAYLCRDRLCPICMWRLAMKRFANMYTIVNCLRQSYPESAWQFVTLTAENCTPEELPTVLDEMLRTWNSITSTKKFKRKIAGWARNLEITYNSENNTLHPHFHILVMWQECEETDWYIIDRWCKGINRKTSWSAQNAKEIGWYVDKSADDAVIVDTILETYKYSIKDSELKEMPLATFKALVESVNGRRFMSFGGQIKEFARMCDMDDDLADEKETDERRCIKCYSSELVDIIGTWVGDGYLWRRRD